MSTHLSYHSDTLVGNKVDDWREITNSSQGLFKHISCTVYVKNIPYNMYMYTYSYKNLCTYIYMTAHTVSLTTNVMTYLSLPPCWRRWENYHFHQTLYVHEQTCGCGCVCRGRCIKRLVQCTRTCMCTVIISYHMAHNTKFKKQTLGNFVTKSILIDPTYMY